MSEIIKHEFKPLYTKDSEILILGSFPSIKSRSNNFYYGHSRNRFWKLIEEFYCCRLENIEDKINILNQNNIALYDIVESCEIQGSLDSNIKNIKIADLNHILENSNIKYILCNGRLSYNLTLKNYPKYKDMIIYLPSTSPANTRFDKNLWKKYLYRKI